MKTLKYFLIALLFPAFVLTGCKDEKKEDDSKSAHKILVEYLVAQNLDLDAILTDWIVPASGVVDDLDAYNVIDIRKSTDFNSAHIVGAVNCPLADVITKAGEFATKKTILVVCYTGQGAGHAVVALRLSGYTDTKVLKWGMSSWGPSYSAPWDGNAKQLDDLTNWTTDVSLSSPATFSEPNITSSSQDGATILAAQVNTMLEGGFSGITNTDVLSGYSSYFINNFWAIESINKYGHIKEAYNIKPLTIANGLIYHLDPSKDIVTYCWTGQTSSMITAYLTVLGYKAYSLKFGANGMIHDDLEEHKWSTPSTDLPVE